jgi:subtilase family serine protease
MLIAVAVIGTGLYAAPGKAAASSLAFSPFGGIAGRAFTAIPGSVRPVSDVATGEFRASQMSVAVVLAPRNEAQLNGLLTDLYNPASQNYQHWLERGRFDALFAPTSAQVAAVAAFLRASGLSVLPSSSPFFVRASGSSAAVSAAFRTSLRTYRSARGVAYFSNASAVQVPANLAAGVLGVVGLTNTVRPQSQIRRPLNGRPSAATSCEAPYPTRAQLYAAVNEGVSFPFGFGAGPGCNGLAPSQDNSIYGAPHLGPRGKGAGVNLAVFELSAYLHSDIETWAHTFYGRAYAPPLVDISVDGGPLNPVCPSQDTCPPDINGYAGDIEVDADIEMQLAISPDARHILVYNAPNDYTGQTELDEYTRIANDDVADVISSSWAVCENDAGSSYVKAENVIFEKMALQGQSMFGAEGDTGAFGCIRSDGTDIVNVLDPPAQPWVTSVGGTSLESYNPGLKPNPGYPPGIETVWNVDNLCNTSPDEGENPGLFWCAATGAGGGGNSQYWGRPFYQFGRDVTNPYTGYGNGTTLCSLTEIGKPCRETPDISVDADGYTPYAEYCTGNASTPYSDCGTFSGAQTPPGWLGIGGTSLSSPFWSAIIADRDGFQRWRTGNANPLLYLLYNLDPDGYFNGINGFHRTNNNGLFPTTPGYDLATGIGTPKMSAIITGFPQR